MITFDQEGRRFVLRAAAIVLHKGQVLLHRVETDDFWALPGGRVEWLEPAEETIVREMREELGLTVRVERLVWVLENMFSYEGIRFHEIGLYFLVSFTPDASLYHTPGPYRGQEEQLPLVFRWFPVDQLQDEPLYPIMLRTGLRSLPASIEHVVVREP